MGSGQNDGTGNQPSEPKPCANNCGFFGTVGNSNLCSKCYRDFCIQEERAASAVEAPGRVEPAKKAGNRCGRCNRKVGLTGFVCKCGSTFCGVHRYPEKHDCPYDFKGDGRDAISKANPVVKADKVERI